MRVLIIHCTYKYRGGEDTVVEQELDLLRRNGVEAELLEFSNTGRQAVKLAQLPFNLGAYRTVIARIKQIRPDIVHVHNLHFAASLSVYYAVRKMKVPLIHTLHNFRLICPSATLYHNGKLFLEGMQRSFSWKAVMAGVYRQSRLLTGWLMFSSVLHKLAGTVNKCDRYIALTEFGKELFLQSSVGFRRDRIVVKPNFLAVSGDTNAKPGSGFLYIGRLTEEKGILTLLQAIAGSSHQLRIAGDGPLAPVVQDYAVRFTNIHYCQFLSPAEVRKEMQEARALVFPSQWYEGMPLTIIEAFANSLPVIASKLGAMESMVTSDYNGLHFEPRNMSDLRDKIDRIGQMSDDKIMLMKANAWASYEKSYTAEKNFQDLLGIYQSVLKNTPKLKAVPYHHPNSVLPTLTKEEIS